MRLVASCAFGLEALVTRELNELGFTAEITGPGQVEFTGDWLAIAKANLWLRCADRVSILISEFDCLDFDTLFEATKGVRWFDHLATDGFIHVTGGSVKSKLSSVPALQRTVKKAIVEHLLRRKGVDALPEDGPVYRVHVGLRRDTARLTLDTTGPSLHKRGYREISSKAPLKETMAAALVKLSFWRAGRHLIDPFCGGGTILIEAAMMGRQIAPGLRRSFVSEEWAGSPREIWESERKAADQARLDPLPVRLTGTDIHAGALSLARRNAAIAGVADDIHFQQRPFSELTSKRQFGCVITNPPYGERLDPAEIRQLYESMPLVLQRLPTWSHFVLTAYPTFEKLIGREADRRRKLYNGRIECTYYQFHGPHPNSERSDSVSETGGRPPAHAPVFGGLDVKDREQAQLFANRLRKRARHLRRWPTRRGVTCYRLYDRDIPEVPLSVDRYEDWLHIVEFERPHDRDLARHSSWLDLMAETAAKTLEVPQGNVVLKTRSRQRGLSQHEKQNNVGEELVVREGGLKFLVNLTDYTDTGLFLDHRAARALVRDLCPGKRVLNLFAYTGAFSVYAAAGGAREITTVDLSATYLDWGRRNFEANGFHGPQFRFVRSDTHAFVNQLDKGVEFDVIICDPPTFSNSKRTEDVWEVQRDHAGLLTSLVRVLSKDGTLFFSSNYRRLKFDPAAVAGASVREITKRTLPEDYRDQRVHRSWLIRHMDIDE